MGVSGRESAGAGPVIMPVRVAGPSLRGVTLRFNRLAVLTVVVLAFIAAAGCGEPGTVARPVTDPGEGTTIADAVFREVKPRIGELAIAPNPDYGEGTLSSRFDRVCQSDKEWSARTVHDDRSDKGTWYYDANAFQDGSVLIFVVSPRPGPHKPPPGPDSGMQLEAVELLRP